MIDYDIAQKALAAYDYMANPAIPLPDKEKLFERYATAWLPVQRVIDTAGEREVEAFIGWIEEQQAAIDRKHGRKTAEETAANCPEFAPDYMREVRGR